MASEEIVLMIVELAKNVLIYLLPVIGVMAGLTFIFTWLHSITIGASRKIFRD